MIKKYTQSSAEAFQKHTHNTRGAQGQRPVHHDGVFTLPRVFPSITHCEATLGKRALRTLTHRRAS